MGDGGAAALVGLFGGTLLGLAARLGRFCTLGAIEDYFYGGKDLRLRMWALAIGTAVVGSFALIGLGLLSGTDSFYLASQWSPVASIVGGLVFGYGMAMAGNCGYGAVARLGGGDLRNFVIVVVMGMSAYFAMSGPAAYLRIRLFPTPEVASEPQGIAHWIASMSGAPVALIGIMIGVALIALALSSKSMRESPKSIFWSVVVGVAVISAWAGTSWIARTGFDGTPVVSHTFAAPVGETILFFMTSTGQTLSFAIGSVAGVWTGAFIGSLIKGHFRWEACEDPRELRRQITGAAMMGVGAVIALGCSFGQGLSAFSLLSFSAPVTFLAILAGSWLGLRHLIEGVAPTWSFGRGRSNES